MNKEQFKNSNFPEDIVNRIIYSSKNVVNKKAFRVVLHNQSLPLVDKDFYPYIFANEMETLPRNEKGEIRIGIYGVSLYDSLENAEKAIESVNSLRNSETCIAIGETESDKGCISDVNIKTGHFNYFLYDYINKNPVCDFKYINEGDK